MFQNQDKEIKKTDIYTEISKNNRIPDKLDELEELGLIVQTNFKFENNKTTLKLTEEGKKIAELLLSIEQVLNNEDSESEEDYVRDHKESIPDSLSEQQKD